jgi:hypothetical protein
MVRRISTNGAGNWLVWDALRGIGSGNDPYFRLNVNTTQTTNTDYISSLPSGFTVNNPSINDVNAAGSTYLFLAIA